MSTRVTDARKVISRVMITRSRKGNSELADKLRARGFDPVSVDTIEFLPPDDWAAVDGSLRRLREFDWVVFTSATGAESFSRRMNALRLSLPSHGEPAIAAVGEKTGAALERFGMRVDFVPSTFLTEALAAELPDDRGRDLLLLRADIGDPRLVAALEGRGFRVSDQVIYRTSRALGSTRPQTGQVDAIVFASPSAVEAFMAGPFSAEEDPTFLTRSLAACIGPVTAAAARRHGFARILISERHTIEGLVESLEKAVAGGGEPLVA